MPVRAEPLRSDIATMIRPMTATDIEAVHAIEAEVHAYPWRSQHFADSLASGHQCWVLDTDEGILGHAILMPVVDEIELLSIAITARRQGQGLGSRLLHWLLARAHAADLQAMFLEVASRNAPALALYRRAGFEPVGQRRNYYRASDGSTDDALVMRCPLHACTAEASRD